MGKWTLILGIVGIILGGCILLVSMMLPVLTDGRTSWEEAMLGIVPGALILSLSLIAAVAGLVVMLVRGRRTQH